jgi:hypothetical protein
MMSLAKPSLTSMGAVTGVMPQTTHAWVNQKAMQPGIAIIQRNL